MILLSFTAVHAFMMYSTRKVILFSFSRFANLLAHSFFATHWQSRSRRMVEEPNRETKFSIARRLILQSFSKHKCRRPIASILLPGWRTEGFQGHQWPARTCPSSGGQQFQTPESICLRKDLARLHHPQRQKRLLLSYNKYKSEVRILQRFLIPSKKLRQLVQE